MEKRQALFSNVLLLFFIMLGEGSRPPSVHGDIQLRALPAGPRAIFPAVWACSDGGSPFHRIPGNVTASRIILLTGSVSFLGPCPGSRPVGFPNPSARWRRDLPRPDQRPTVGRPPSPSNVLRLFEYFSLLHLCAADPAFDRKMKNTSSSVIYCAGTANLFESPHYRG